jgi:putative acetyltransferase
MTAAAARSISFDIEDPHAADSEALHAEMSAFIDAIYPEDAENGIVPTTTDELAAQGLLVIARVDGAPAGSGALMAHAPVDGLNVFEVKRMMVRPQFRGLGLAKGVLAKVEQIARERGKQKLVLMCGPRQPEALRLYETCGYAVRSAYGKHDEHPLSIFFEKPL